MSDRTRGSLQMKQNMLTQSSATASEEKSPSPSSDMLLQKLYDCVKNALNTQQYPSALLWAEKMYFLNPQSELCRFLLVQSMSLNSDSAGAAHLIKKNQWHTKSPLFAFYLAKLYFSINKIAECYYVCDESFFGQNALFDIDKLDHRLEGFINNLAGAVHLLIAKVYRKKGRNDLAVDHYKRSLLADVTCYEAFSALFEEKLLSHDEMDAILNDLPSEGGSDFADMIEIVYKSRIYIDASNPAAENPFEEMKENKKSNALLMRLQHDCDVELVKAKDYFLRGQYDSAWGVIKKILNVFSHRKSAVLLAISVLHEDNNVKELFNLSHRLTSNNDSDPVALYATGVYYMSVKQQDDARKYFQLATKNDPEFGSAWVAYGHSFSMLSEHDYAMGAYVRAACMKGCHLPMLFLGIEHAASGSPQIAHQFFEEAALLAPNDIQVHHESGIAKFNSGEYTDAIEQFDIALEKSKSAKYLNKYQYSIYENLGHANRKIGRYEASVDFHKKALEMRPSSSETKTALSLSLAMCHKFNEALDYLLTMNTKHSSPIVNTLLNTLLDCREATTAIPGDMKIEDLLTDDSETDNQDYEF